MLRYVIKRLLYMIPTLFGMSLVAFLIIQLPPGDYLTSMLASMADSGVSVDETQIQRYREIYGFDDPPLVQYWKWISGIIFRGDFGFSFEWNRPVRDLIFERMGSTLSISVLALLFVWAMSLPIGIYSAVRRHSAGDYFFTLLGFIGLAIPNFIMALALMYISYKYLGQTVGGLYSQQYVDAPWSWDKFLDLLSHLWIPVVVIGTKRHRGLDPHPPRQPHRRTQQALRRNRQGQRPAGIQGGAEVPGAHRTQSVRLSDRLGAAGADLWRHHHRHRSQPADGRPAAAARPDDSGHVPRRQHHPPARRPDADRHADLRSAARRARSAHPVQLMTAHTHIEGVVETGPAVSPLKPGTPVDLAAASQWRLIWQKFTRHKVAVVAGYVIAFLIFVAIFAEFLAPALPEASRPQFTYAPPQDIAFFVTDENGNTSFKPHVKGYSQTVDQASLRRTFVVDETKIVPIGFFVEGAPYKMWGLIPMNVHLMGPVNPSDTMYLLGSDKLGRDLLTRLIYGTRVSMSIGLIGVCISLLLGVVLGSLSGFYGGWVDLVIQRVIEVISSMPTIPLWLGLAAAGTADLVAAAGLLHDHADRLFVRLDRTGARSAWSFLRAAGRGLRHRRAARRLDRTAADLPSHPALAHEPHPRRRHAGAADDDRRRDRIVLPRHRAQGTGRVVGRAAAGRAERRAP